MNSRLKGLPDSPIVFNGACVLRLDFVCVSFSRIKMEENYKIFNERGAELLETDVSKICSL